MFKELKETTYRELKEIIRMMFHQNENINREKLLKKRNQTETLELKTTIIEIKSY